MLKLLLDLMQGVGIEKVTQLGVTEQPDRAVAAPPAYRGLGRLLRDERALGEHGGRVRHDPIDRGLGCRGEQRGRERP